MSNTRTTRLAGVLVALFTTATVVAGCAGGGGNAASGRGWIDGAPSRESASGAMSSSTTAMESGDSMAASDVAVAPGAPMPPDTPVSNEPKSAALRAGSVDDNEQWEDYLLYRQDFLGRGIQVHDVDISARRIVTVKNSDGRPVLGATVRMFDGDSVVAEARTHADGRVFLFPKPDVAVADAQQRTSSMHVTVEHGDARADAPVSGASELTVTLAESSANARVALDIMFVIDATGSMADEIEQLKANITSISDQLREAADQAGCSFCHDGLP